LKNKRQLVINFFSSSLAFVVGPVINFILYPYLIKHIGVEAFGFTGLALSFVSYAQLVTIALNSMAGRFITIKIHENDYDGANRYMNSVFWANAAIGALILAASAACVYYLENLVRVPAEILLDVKMLFAFTFFSFFLNVMDATFGVGVFASNRLEIAAIRDIATGLLRACVLFVLYWYFAPRVSYIGIAALIMNAAILVTNVIFTAKLLPKLVIDRKFFDFKAVLEIASAGVWNVFSKLGAILSQGLDLLIANLFISATAMGTVSVSKTIPVVLLSVLIMIANLFSPQITISYAQKDFEEIKRQVKFLMKMVGMFISLPVALILVYGDSFYTLWLPTQDAQLLRWLTFVSVGGLAISGSIQGLSNIYTVVNKIKTPTIFSFAVSMVNLGLIFILLHFSQTDTQKMFVVTGVTAAVGIICNMTFTPIYAAKCLGYKWNEFYSEMMKNIFSFAAVSGALFFVKKFFSASTWTQLVLLAVVTAAVGLALNLFVVFSRQERGRLYTLFYEKVAAKFLKNGAKGG
jgi:O-antigen/teichoic acid export membrane protein